MSDGYMDMNSWAPLTPTHSRLGILRRYKSRVGLLPLRLISDVYLHFLALAGLSTSHVYDELLPPFSMPGHNDQEPLSYQAGQGIS